MRMSSVTNKVTGWFLQPNAKLEVILCSEPLHTYSPICGALSILTGKKTSLINSVHSATGLAKLKTKQALTEKGFREVWSRTIYGKVLERKR